MAETFAYRVRTREGKVVAGTMEADGASTVASRLRAQGFVPVQINKEAKISAKTEITIIPKKVKLKDLAIFSRQFATMINSGLSLLRSLYILSEQTENEGLRDVIVEVR
ncbi:MAG TPA: type II secretion system F family protein, partial [Actinomycetota bacterium]|nr:type II secretion system F family protein [Actinomycetota bacterium]